MSNSSLLLLLLFKKMQNLSFQTLALISQLLDFLLFSTMHPYNLPPRILIPFCLWPIQIQRNKLIFKNKPFRISPYHIINQASKFQYLARKQKSILAIVQLYIKQNPLTPLSYLMFNTNGIYCKHTNPRGISGIFRYLNGELILVVFIHLRTMFYLF